MSALKEAVDDFLAQKRIAVVGVSRSGSAAANVIYRKLRDTGYQVFAVNPNAGEVDGDKCYPDLGSIPEGVDGVVVATHPKVSAKIVRDSVDIGVSRIWMHRSFGKGSVSEDGVKLCREKNVTIIAGGCPMMFCEPVDFGHKCVRWILKLTGGLPKHT